jgi:hypothetical protein
MYIQTYDWVKAWRNKEQKNRGLTEQNNFVVYLYSIKYCVMQYTPHYPAYIRNEVCQLHKSAICMKETLTET